MNERALTTTLDVDDALVERKSAQLMKHSGGLFPRDMTPGQAAGLARIALAYGLDPMAEEIIVYASKIYLTLRGAVRIANQHPQFEGLECEPATREQRQAFRCGVNEHLWVARVWRKDRRFPIVGYGRAVDDGTGANLLEKRWAQEMAQKRAKHRALRDAFSLPLPEAPDGLDVDVDHGEHRGAVVDGEAHEIPEITPGQIAAIHAVVTELGWSDEVYRLRLEQAFGVRSSKELSRGQAAALLETLAAAATGEATPGVKPGDRPAGWGAPAILDEDELMGELARRAADDPPDAEPRFFGRAHATADPATGERADPRPADPIVDQAAALFTGGPPSQRALDEFATALTRGAQLGLDLIAYECNPTEITAAQLAALHDNLLAEIDAAEPPERLAGM